MDFHLRRGNKHKENRISFASYYQEEEKYEEENTNYNYKVLMINVLWNFSKIPGKEYFRDETFYIRKIKDY